MPFFVVHGWWIAKVAVIVCGLLGLGVIEALRRLYARWFAQDEVAALRAEATGPAPGDVTVVGQYHERGDERWLQCGDERLDVLAPPTVVRGRRARWPWRASEPIHTVADGDEVIASGCLERVASADEAAASYRSSHGAWAFTDVELTSTRPAPPPRRLRVLALYCAAAFAASAWVGDVGLRKLGHSLVDKDFDRSGRRDLSRVPLRYALAAALPGTRRQALSTIRELIERRFPADAASTALRIELAQLRSGCRGRAEVLASVHHFEEAYEAANACGATDLVVEDLLALGRYDDAAARAAEDPSAVPLDARVVAALGAGRWADAVTAANAFIARARQGEQSGVAAERLRRLECTAELFGSYGGDQKARKQLGLAARRSAFCRALDAFGRDDIAELNAALADVPQLQRYDFYPVVLLLGAAPQDNSDAYDAPTSLTVFSAMGFERVLTAPFAYAARKAPDTHAWLAVYDMVRGDVAAALVEARTTDRLLRYLHLETAVRLRAGARDVAVPKRAPIATWARLRAGKPLSRYDRRELGANLLPFVDDCKGEVAPAVDAAIAGDGGPFARLMRECRPMWDPTARFLLAVLPVIRHHRDSLAVAVEALNTFEGAYGLHGQRFYVRWLAHVWTARDLARLSGNRRRFLAWQAILERHLQVCRHRDRLAALLLWRKQVL